MTKPTSGSGLRKRGDGERAGIPYAAGEVKELQDEAKRAGIQPLVVADRPITA